MRKVAPGSKASADALPERQSSRPSSAYRAAPSAGSARAGSATRLNAWWRLIRADRPIGIALLLWPAWWGLWLAAEGFPPPKLLLIFTAGVVLTRSAGCIINDYADRWLDGQVERTRDRPLATGEISGRRALLGFAVLMLVAFGLVLLTNRLTVLLALVAAALAVTYPYLKRHTWFPQVWLGLAFGWSIPMAFTAVRGEVPALAWLPFLGNLAWTTAYDTWYAMVDRDDDIQAGARSTAILFGRADLAALAVMYGLAGLALILTGLRFELPWPFYAALAAAAAMAGWIFWIGRDRTREGAFRAFRLNNWVGGIIFIGIAAAYLL